MSLKAFLQIVKKQIESSSISPIRFVTGNQSADLDSVISALGYSYLNYQYDSSLLIPMINIPRQDYKLRRDINHVLESHAVTEDMLYFIEDVAKISGTGGVKVTLVDHCNLQGETLINLLKEGKLTVESIIDHHADEGVFLDAEPRVISVNGSCSSLVFNYWYNKINNIAVFKKNNGDIARAFIAPLLIDTSNMTSKVENGDIEALEKYKTILESEVAVTQFNDTFTDFYKTVKRAKKDMTGFNVSDVLRKDYKQFEFNGITVGFSSMGKSAYWLLKTYTPQEILTGVDDLIDSFGLDLLLATPSHTDKVDQYRREMIIVYNKGNKNTILGDFETKLDSLQLDESVFNIDKVEDVLKDLNKVKTVRILNQQNLAASRKQIVPAVKEVLEK